MTTLAEHIIVAGAKNRPPILEKSMYDSWESRIRLFIKGKKHGRMMLDSIDNGLLVYQTVEENGQTRPMKYSELTEAQQLQDDCDVQATNIILHGLPPGVYAFVNHQEAAKDIWDRVKLLMRGTKLSYQERECRLYNLFDKFAYVQEHHLILEIKQPFKMVESQFNKFKEEKIRVMLTIPYNLPFKTEDLDAYNSDCDDLYSAKAVLMANLSSYDLEVLSECSVEKNDFEIQIKQLSTDNDQLLKQIMSQDIVHIVVNSVDILDVQKSCVNECNKCLELETEVVQFILWYLDFGCSKHMTGNRSQLINFVSKFLGTVTFGNDHIAKITGYGDYHIDAPSISTSQTPPKTPSPVIPLVIEEANHDIEVAHMDNNPFVEFPIPEPSYEESSTQVVIPNYVHPINQPPKHINKWTKDHPINNVFGNPSRPVST
nr:integrase, catalytic region, zinc finger, CCHC-type, peptidase aspartic, catalytic [Tanacetum cinerariifolium]